MQHFLLINHLVDDYILKRVAYRAEHLALANRFFEEGHLVMAGALTDPADTSVLVFKVDDIAVIQDFIQQDPYAKAGLIHSFEIRAWNVVIG